MRDRWSFSILVLAAALAYGAPAPGADVFSQEKCSLCHIRQSVFFDPGLQRFDGVKNFGEERLCGSCHNGSVRDSRAVLWRGAQHPSPSAGGKSDGKRCTRCHTPHGKGGWEVLAGTSLSLKKGGEGICAGCHPRHRLGSGAIHRTGFPEGGCKECHQAHGGVGKYFLKEAKETLCLRCHSSVAAEKSGGHPLSRQEGAPGTGTALPDCGSCHPVHPREAVAESRTAVCNGCHAFKEESPGKKRKRHPAEENCLECHSFHAKSGEGGRKLRGKDIAAEALCGRCHEGYLADSVKKGSAKGTHVTTTPGGKEEICLRCHRVHGAAPGTALLVSGKAYSCLGCHEGQNTIRETGGIRLAHPVFERVARGRLARAEKTRNLRLGPSGEIVCATCHAIHRASRNTTLLAAESIGSKSCFWCHEDMSGRQHARLSETGREMRCEICHPVHGKENLGEDPWGKVCSGCHEKGSTHLRGKIAMGGSSTAIPVFDDKGRKVGIGRISCPTCHEPHGVETRKNALRREYMPSAFLCTACHREKESVALTPHDLRGVVGKSICEPCHVPHGGSSDFVAGAATGAWLAGEETCRSCHREKGLANSIPAGGHPRNISVTRPLPGIFPLQGADKTRSKSGVMVCATCHEVHGTGLIPTGKGVGKLLREPGCGSCHDGKLESHGKAECRQCHPPHLERKATDECESCHPRGEKGTHQAHLKAGKSCDACHRVHHEANGKTSAESRCVSCHPLEGRLEGTPHGLQKGGVCQACHPAHRETDMFAVKRKVWDVVMPADAICLGCHRENGIGSVLPSMEHPKRKKELPTTYGATVTVETPIVLFGHRRTAQEQNFPLFDETGKVATSGQMGCLTCHDPHAAIPGKEGRRSAAAYLRDTTGMFLADLCAPCHREDARLHARKFHELPRKTD